MFNYRMSNQEIFISYIIHLIHLGVGVAQLVTPLPAVQVVMGSSPIH
jgi:hypothetical protein